MIIDLPRFIETERPLWAELEAILDKLEADPAHRMDLQRTQRFHYLYQRVLSDLARIVTFSSEPETRRYLESLTARAYGEMNESREKSLRFSPLKWLIVDFPRVFRRQVAYFWLSTAIFLAGTAFGCGTMAVDPNVKMILMPQEFHHLYQTPTQRVKEEEESKESVTIGEHTEFSAELMNNNIHITFYTFAFGIIYGLGSMIFLFYNGIILGMTAFDYVQDGQSIFLMGWLLPHGVIEIPACLIAGQAGLLLGRTVLGRGDRLTFGQRLRLVRMDLSMLVFGSAAMLIWAGIVESFLSQYHKPVIPYSSKITFGIIELIFLIWFLAGSGRRGGAAAPAMSSELKIRTPEGIDFSLPLAGPVLRCMAWLLDFACMIALMYVALMILRLFAIFSESLSVALMVIAIFLIQIGYGIICEWFFRGQTLGKRMLKLRVVDEQGLRLEFTQVVVRNLMRFVDLLPGCYAVGGLACFMSKRCQRLGDLAANTVVIRHRPVLEPDLDQLAFGKYNSLREYGHLAARLRQRVSPQEAGIALEALLRRDSFDPAARLSLFADIASRFKSIVVFPPEAVESLTDEQYLRNVVDVLFRTHK